MKRLVLFVVLVAAVACSIDLNMPDRLPPYWCYSDSIKAARDSFPYCPPDSIK
jgi:hypothetical protein